jgi:DNA polymerase-4
VAEHPGEREITLLAVSVSKLADQPALQLELPLDPPDARRPGGAIGAARRAVDQSVDTIRSRFGSHAVGYAAVVFSPESRVPDAFRKLAEHGGP